MLENYLDCYLDAPGMESCQTAAGERHCKKIPVLQESVPPPGAQLWRFMDFERLSDILDRAALFFTRVDKFDDKFEGTWSKATLELLAGTVEREVISKEDHIILNRKTDGVALRLLRAHQGVDKSHSVILDSILNAKLLHETQVFITPDGNIIFHHAPTNSRFILYRNKPPAAGEPVPSYRLADDHATLNAVVSQALSIKQRMPYILVSCWHESEFESPSMWRTYAPGPHGVAVKTTVRRLVSSFTNRLPDAVARVTYIPYDQAVMQQDVYTPFLFKRKNFSHEREVRVIIDDSIEYQDLGGSRSVVHLDLETSICDVGMHYDIRSPYWLIREIVVSPFADLDLQTMLKASLKNRKLGIPVTLSRLNPDSTEPVHNPLGNWR